MVLFEDISEGKDNKYVRECLVAILELIYRIYTDD